MRRILLCLGLVSLSASAEFLELPQLTPAQTEAVMQNLSPLLQFRSVDPASCPPGNFGVSIGVIAKLAPPTLLSFTGVSRSLPAGEIFAALHLPYGLAIELGLLPSMSLGGTSFSNTGIAAKWTLSERALSKLPFSLALRSILTMAGLSYNQQVTGQPVTVTYKTTTVTLQAQASKSVSILEPFLGLGLIFTSSELSGVGPVSLFGTGYAGGTLSDSLSFRNFWLQVGLKIKLGPFGISAAYDRIAGVSVGSGKVGFTF